MAKVKVGDVALLSIRPRYATAILAGHKRVEFRKRRFRRQVSHIVIYATSPLMRVVGYFSIARITTGSPAALWARYRHCAGIGLWAFKRYFGEACEGTAFEVGFVQALREPLVLGDIDGNLAPPQSFVYLDRGAFERLADATEIAHVARRRTWSEVA